MKKGALVLMANIRSNNFEAASRPFSRQPEEKL